MSLKVIGFPTGPGGSEGPVSVTEQEVEEMGAEELVDTFARSCKWISETCYRAILSTEALRQAILARMS